MFVLDQDSDEGRTIKNIPVIVKTIGDGGAVSQNAMTLDYKILPTDQSDAIIKAAQEGDSDADILKEVVVGWGQVKDADGKEVEFSQEQLANACRHANFRTAALDVYFRVASGNKPRRGN